MLNIYLACIHVLCVCSTFSCDMYLARSKSTAPVINSGRESAATTPSPLVNIRYNTDVMMGMGKHAIASLRARAAVEPEGDATDR